MKTTAYKTLRALIQLVSVGMMLANAAILVMSLYRYDIWSIESDVTSDYIFTYYQTCLYIISANILLGIFCNCGSTSGSKFLMYICTRLLMCSSIIGIIAVIYFRWFYLDFFGSSLGAKSGQSYEFSRLLTGKTNIKQQDSNVLLIKEAMRHLISVFAIIELITIGCNIIIMILLHYNMKIELWKKPQPAPNIVDSSRRGMDSTALASIKVIDTAD